MIILIALIIGANIYFALALRVTYHAEGSYWRYLEASTIFMVAVALFLDFLERTT